MPNYTPSVAFAFELQVLCDPPVPLGRIQGGDGLMIPIVGGTVSGPRLTGEVMAGGADWAIRKENGLAIVDARYAIRASDGTIIQVFNGGAVRFAPPAPGQPLTVLTTPRFIAPEGPHEWLNTSVFAGTLTPGAPAIHVGIFTVS